MRSATAIHMIVGLGLTGVSLVGCSGTETGAPKPASGSSATDTQTMTPWQPSDDPKSARFLRLKAPKPATWIDLPPTTSMRAANYTVPGRDGHEAAHVIVFYFGPGQGGTVDESILRWQSQFRPDPDGTPQQAKVERFEVDGMPVTLVELAGEWQKMGATRYTRDQLFLSAIVETPVGNVFIRFAGQTATVQANREAFMTMIRGVRKDDEN